MTTVVGGPAGAAAAAPAAVGAPKTFYVDCAGNDANTGRSPARAWQTLDRANTAPLGPSWQLLLKRGCTWDQQTLDASWVGQPSAPVTIGTYGSGPKPLISNGKAQNVEVSGAYQVISNVAVSFTPTTFTSCGEPLGNHYGFNIVAGGHDNTIQFSSAAGECAGMHVAAGAYGNHLLHNLLSGNNMVDAFHADPSTDLGAWGVLIDGDSNEIGFNRLQDNIALCSNQGYKLASNSIELFTARGNTIHHNISLRDRVFSELGSSSAVQSSDNTYAYNVFATAVPDSRFITTRGALDTQFGPVLNTSLVHNSTYQTGARSIAISCGLGCGSDVLTTDSNIFWADGKVVVADATFPNQNDIIWSTNGAPAWAKAWTSNALIADPRYARAGSGNLRLLSASPAIGAGNIVGDWGVDAYGKPLPAGPGTDEVGAAQFS